MTVFRDDDKELEGLERMEVGEVTEDDEKRREEEDGEGLEVGRFAELAAAKLGSSCCWVVVVAEAAANKEPRESDLEWP